jgi:hypothetical protein
MEEKYKTGSASLIPTRSMCIDKGAREKSFCIGAPFFRRYISWCYNAGHNIEKDKK